MTTNNELNPIISLPPFTKEEIKKFGREWESLNFPNNPLSQPEPCEETKEKLFGKQNITTF